MYQVDGTVPIATYDLLVRGVHPLLVSALLRTNIPHLHNSSFFSLVRPNHKNNNHSATVDCFRIFDSHCCFRFLAMILITTSILEVFFF